MTTKDDGMTIKDTQKHRNLFIACAVVAVIAIAVGGFWVWTSVERSTALADCNESVKLAKTGVLTMSRPVTQQPRWPRQCLRVTFPT